MKAYPLGSANNPHISKDNLPRLNRLFKALLADGVRQGDPDDGVHIFFMYSKIGKVRHSRESRELPEPKLSDRTFCLLKVHHDEDDPVRIVTNNKIDVPDGSHFAVVDPIAPTGRLAVGYRDGQVGDVIDDLLAIPQLDSVYFLNHDQESVEWIRDGAHVGDVLDRWSWIVHG